MLHLVVLDHTRNLCPANNTTVPSVAVASHTTEVLFKLHLIVLDHALNLCPDRLLIVVPSCNTAAAAAAAATIAV
jgi:hypothetical protein